MRRALKWVAIGVGVLLVALLGVVGLALTGVIGPPEVPQAAIEGSVRRGESLDAAFDLPVAATFGPELYWQSNGTFCGPASLVNVFRSFGESVDDERSVLQGSGKCQLGLCLPGLTLDELAHVARSGSSGRTVTVLRDLSPEQFLEHMRRSNDPSQRYIINFTRKEIFGSGGGHHSPIGGYLEREDLVLVLDVNEKFRPWLVERERLFAAMNTLDGDQKRGMLMVESR